MYNDDYVIFVDEKGQPYIAHASVKAAWGSVSGRAKKYIDKVKTKNGKWRYFYTPQELQAFYREKKYSSNKNVKSSSDLQKAQAAKNVASQARKRVQGNRQEAAAVAKNRASATGRKVSNFIDKHDAGISEAIRYRKASKSSDTSAQDKARYEREWKNSVIGKAANTVNKHAKTTLSSIRNAGTSVKNLGKKIDDIGIDDAIRLGLAKSRGAKTTQDLQKLQKAQYDFNQTSIGKRKASKKK